MVHTPHVHTPWYTHPMYRSHGTHPMYRSHGTHPMYRPHGTHPMYRPHGTHPMYRPHGTHPMYIPMVHTPHVHTPCTDLMVHTPCTDPMVHTPHVDPMVHNPMYRPHGTHTSCTYPMAHTPHVHNPSTDPMAHTSHVQTAHPKHGDIVSLIFFPEPVNVKFVCVNQTRCSVAEVRFGMSETRVTVMTLRSQLILHSSASVGTRWENRKSISGRWQNFICPERPDRLVAETAGGSCPGITLQGCGS